MFLREDYLIFCQAVSQNDHSIIGTGIAIDNNHIKRLICHRLDCTFQNIRRNSCVSGYKGKQCRHIGVYHACAFGNAGNSCLLATYFKLISDLLNKSICCLDGKSCAFAFSFIHFINCVGNSCFNLVHRQKMANDAS